MERCLGVDVHRESCTISVVSEAGKEGQRQVVETNGRALVSFVRQLAGRPHVCLEEGEWSQWLFEVLSPDDFQAAGEPNPPSSGEPGEP